MATDTPAPHKPKTLDTPGNAQCLLFGFGCVLFTFGALATFDNSSHDNATTGAAFTVGSCLLVVADYLEWRALDLPPTLRASGMYFLGLAGSLLYLVGSILIIPSVGGAKTGLWLFAVGSICLLLAALALVTNAKTSTTKHKWGGIGVGAIFFFMGSVMFIGHGNTIKPSADAAGAFLAGSIGFDYAAAVVSMRLGCYSNRNKKGDHQAAATDHREITLAPSNA